MLLFLTNTEMHLNWVCRFCENSDSRWLLTLKLVQRCIDMVDTVIPVFITHCTPVFSTLLAVFTDFFVKT